jgi:hypothetical protein
MTPLAPGTLASDANITRGGDDIYIARNFALGGCAEPPPLSSISCLDLQYPQPQFEKILRFTMSSEQFLRTAQNGVNIYLRLESNTFRCLPIAESQAALLGQRVAEEYEKDAARDPAIGETTKKTIVE